MAVNTTVESETLEAFLPDLVTAICDDVQCITDQCLASGLISDSRRRRILELKGSKDQARSLIQCVQNSTKTDSRCFEIFLDSLDKELPRLVKEKLLPGMRKDLADRAIMRKAVIPVSRSQLNSAVEDDRLQCIQQQSSLFGRYESSVKKYAHASAEKTLFEETLQNKTKESGRLREDLKSQSSEVDTKEIGRTMERLSACEMEMSELKERIKNLEGVIQEEDMQARRGKSTIMVGTKMFARMTDEQFAAALREKEEQYKRSLKEQEYELRRRIQEEMDAKMKDLKHRVALQERDNKMALQEKNLQIKELELRNARMQETISHPFPGNQLVLKSMQRQPAAPQRQLESHKGATVSKLFKQRNLDDIQRVRYRPIASDSDISSSPEAGYGTCRLPGCNRPKYYDPANGMIQDFCGRAHAYEATRRGIDTSTCSIRPATVQEFSAVTHTFKEQWERKYSRPNIDYVYVITNTKLSQRWTAYQHTLSDRTVEKYYHGTKLACNIATTQTLCTNQDCGICGIASIGFDCRCIRKNSMFQRFGHGFYLTPNSSNCHNYTQGFGKYRAMLLCDVCPGNKYRLQLQTGNVSLRGPPQGYDSVLGNLGETLEYDELVVYNPDAVMPRYILVYQKGGTGKIASR